MRRRAEHPSPHGVVDVGLSGLPAEFMNLANHKTVVFQTDNLRYRLQLLLKGVNWIQKQMVYAHRGDVLQYFSAFILASHTAISEAPPGLL
jgi:hypothetical protein